MILGMSRSDTIKKLLNEKAYNSYINYINSSLTDSGLEKNVQTESDNSFKSNMQDIMTIASMIMQRALSYTPIKTGELRKSVYIKSIGSGIAVGFSKEYAIHVHEIGFYLHNAPTKYKFLEDAAFEIATEQEVPYRISISYAPLEVYINVENMGTDLISIKNNEKHNKLLDTKNKVWTDFVNFDRSKATEDEVLHHEKMTQFFSYWRSRNVGDWATLHEWQDRQRHE